MLNISSDVLGLSSDAAILVRQGRIIFTNESARSVFQHDCCGRTLTEVLGAELSGIQAGSFVATALICGKQYIVRSSKLDETQALFLTPSHTSGDVINDAFLASMRSVLMNIQLSLGLCREHAQLSDSDEILRDVSSLTRSYYFVKRQIDNAAALRMLSDSSMPFEPHAADLVGVCTSVTDSLALLRRDIRVTVSGEHSIILPIDSVLIQRLLLNLISNCLTHAQGCSVISVSFLATADCAIMSVSDDGCGIPPELMHTVFDRYRHISGKSLPSINAGIGLTVVRGIAALHHGTVMLESRSGHGTTVRVSLSRRTAERCVFCDAQDKEDMRREELLTGLAGCIPDLCYTERYLD